MIAWFLCEILHKHSVGYIKGFGYRCTRCGMTLKEAREQFYKDIRRGDK